MYSDEERDLARAYLKASARNMAGCSGCDAAMGSEMEHWNVWPPTAGGVFVPVSCSRCGFTVHFEVSKIMRA